MQRNASIHWIIISDTLMPESHGLVGAHFIHHTVVYNKYKKMMCFRCKYEHFYSEEQLRLSSSGVKSTYTVYPFEMW